MGARSPESLPDMTWLAAPILITRDPDPGAPRLVAPQRQPWGHVEGHLPDPDGHLLRYGSPLPATPDA